MYVKITNGSVDTYPYNVGQLRRDNPNTSFPKVIPEEMLNSYGVYSVVFADVPEFNARTQNVTQNSEPTLVDSVWTLGYTITNKTEEEIQQYDEQTASLNRGNRDRLLSETDWVVTKAKETGTTIPTAWKTYRQALRDITAHANWPHLVNEDWPVKP